MRPLERSVTLAPLLKKLRRDAVLWSSARAFRSDAGRIADHAHKAPCWQMLPLVKTNQRMADFQEHNFWQETE